jgi:5'-phosphate synthase pdxT subunit
VQAPRRPALPPRPGKLNITRVGVLALQGDVREHLAAFGRCGVESIAVRLADELEAVDALAIPGGESTTMSKLLRAFALEQPLRRRLDAGLPTLTTCAGLILLSRAIRDGTDDQLATGTLDVTVLRNGYGSQVDSFEADVEVQGIGDTAFRAVFIRAPRITDVGTAVEVLARLEGGTVAIRQGAHIGLTFHPEMTGDDRIHRLFLEQVDAARDESAA